MLSVNRALLLIALLGCRAPEQPPPAEPVQTAEQTAAPPAPAPPNSWSVIITSGGGFIGHGHGGVMVSSDGAIRANRFMSPWCNSVDLGEDRAALERAVAQAKPELWMTSYKPICCDHFSYVLEFQRNEEGKGEVVYKTSWQGVPPGFPSDLQALSAAVWQLQKRALAACPDR